MRIRLSMLSAVRIGANQETVNSLTMPSVSPVGADVVAGLAPATVDVVVPPPGLVPSGRMAAAKYRPGSRSAVENAVPPGATATDDSRRSARTLPPSAGVPVP